MKLTFKGKVWWPQEFAVCMAMDAFRLCLFGKPSNFTKREVIAWIEAGKDTEVHKQSTMKIIMNDLDSMVERIEALEAHPKLTEAMTAVQSARAAMIDARSDIHRRDMEARFAKADASNRSCL